MLFGLAGVRPRQRPAQLPGCNTELGNRGPYILLGDPKFSRPGVFDESTVEPVW